MVALRRLAALVVGLLLLAPSVAADEVPAIARPVTDHANVYSPAQEESLAGELVALREQTGVQMAVLTVDKVDGAIDTYAQRVFDTWGGGSAERNDGVLFVLAVGSRQSRLHLGYGIEPVLSDSHAKQLLDAMRTKLRAQDYAGATSDLIADVAAAVAHLEPGAPISKPLGQLPYLPAGVLLLAFALALAGVLVAFGRWSKQAHSERVQYVRAINKSLKKRDRRPLPEASKPASRRTQGIIAAALLLVGPLAVLLLFGAGSGFRWAYLALWGVGTLFGAFAGHTVRSGLPLMIFWGMFGFAPLLVTTFVVLTPEHLTGGDVLESLLIVGGAAGVGTLFTWLVTLGASTSGGSSSYSSSSYTSSSYSSSSYSSSSYSSSDWSGGGGSSGGGGASSSW